MQGPYQVCPNKACVVGSAHNRIHVNNPLLAVYAMTRRHYAVTLEQASLESPVLAQLASLSRDSSARLRAVQDLIPAMLRTSIQAGPIEGATWCLLVSSNSAAAKLRQLLPTLAAHLRTKGWDVQSIRLKVQARA